MALSRSPATSTPQQGLSTSAWLVMNPPPMPGGPELDAAPPPVLPSRVAWLQSVAGNTAASDVALPAMEGEAGAREQTEALDEVREILGKGWVGPWDERRLVELWTSFGPELAAVRAAHPELWTQSRARGAELGAIEAAAEGSEPTVGFAPMNVRPWPVAPTAPPTVAPPAPSQGPGPGGPLASMLAWAARRIVPVIAGLWPKATAAPELDTPPPELLRGPAPEPAPAGPLGPVPEVTPIAPEDDPCRIQVKCPHRGGDRIHDACADALSDNEFQGCDVFVNGKNFDAFNKGSKTLWEVKTLRMENYPSFLVDNVVDRQLKEAEEDRKLAEACGFDFAFSVSDQVNYEALKAAVGADTLLNLVYRPECL